MPDIVRDCHFDATISKYVPRHTKKMLKKKWVYGCIWVQCVWKENFSKSSDNIQIRKSHLELMSSSCHLDRALNVEIGVECKVIHTKYSKHRPYTAAHTIECVCSKINHGLNHGLFISLLKLINCPIHWIVYEK